MNPHPNPPRKPAGIGPDMGLTVLLNLSRSDYYYPLKNFVGATALIFDPEEFADSATGAVREVPIDPYNEVRITLNIKTKIAVEEVQRYSVGKRKNYLFFNPIITFRINCRRLHVSYRFTRGIQRQIPLW
jgi:hypothetical protein